MAIDKQSLNLPFAQGMDQKTDSLQVQPGKLLALQNAVFQKGGMLQKRNGYAPLVSLPQDDATYLTTFNGNLTAVGESIYAYSTGQEQWVTRGKIQPLSLSTLPVVRNNLNQTQCDAAVAPNGTICTVYTETDGTTTSYKYVILDPVTGQNIFSPTAIVPGSGAVTNSPRVFAVGSLFVIGFTALVSGVNHLRYVSISSINPSVVSIAQDIASAYTPGTHVTWDGVVVNDSLYLAWNTQAGGQSVKVTYLTHGEALGGSAPPVPTTFSGETADICLTMCADLTVPSSPIIYAIYNSTVPSQKVLSVNAELQVILPPTSIAGVGGGGAINITAAALNGVVHSYWETSGSYSYDSGIPNNDIIEILIQPVTAPVTSVFSSGASTITVTGLGLSQLVVGMVVSDVTTPSNIASNTTITAISGSTITLSNATAGNSASSPGDILYAVLLTGPIGAGLGLGLASKAFILQGSIYYFASYQSLYQSTYFLINGTATEALDGVGVAAAARVAYSNGGGYLPTGLPNVAISADNVVKIPYLYKDLIASVNKDTNVPAGTQTDGIYSQLGVNLASFLIGPQPLDSAEIGNNLNISGGFLWMYDGYLPVEQGFFLYPDSIEATWHDTGGSMHAQPDGTSNNDAYFYQVCYEWTDNQGNAFRSAPSIPVAVTTTGSGTTGSVTINFPNLRVTYKTANPVKIVIYRWSVAQQVYYQVTSISAPLLNTSSDSNAFLDKLADPTILGNNILYTTGGVVEDVGPPATNIMTLFDTRLWLVDAEDPNLLWFSKQVLESTPAELSDLLTLYIAPTTAAQGSTGPITALSVMDDKLIIFKQNAIYYINGTGPDNTGANNQYSQPIFITSTVGCDNQQSIVFMPQGLMFQSDKGIWLLGRDLNTQYVGAPVEDFNSSLVQSAVNVPATNQVRFTLDTGQTLMFDYYYNQWGTFVGVPAISSCIFQNLHTFLNASGAVLQETPGLYQDGPRPVLLSFQTAWFNLAGLQGYERAYEFYLLATYLSPHKLQVQVCYDYNNSPEQSNLIQPDNYAAPWGGENVWGGGKVWGGSKSLEQWRVFLRKQKTQAISIIVNEIFDPSFGTLPGAGLNLHGLDLTVGVKKGRPSLRASRQVG